MKNRHGLGEEFWKRLVAEVKEGASLAEVARLHGVSQSALGKWRLRLASRRGVAAEVSLLPVRAASAKARVEIIMSGHRLSFEEGTNVDYIRTLLRSLAS